LLNCLQMEVTRTLRIDRLSKTGLAQIHLTFCWDGQRLRMGSKQRCAPKDWDARRGRAKKGYTYAETINQVLDDYTDAATAAEHDALRDLRPLDGPQLQQEITQRYAALVAARTGLPELPALPAAEPLSFYEEFARWIEVERTKISVRTGRPLTKDTIWTHNAVLTEIKAYAAASKQPVTFAGLTQAFYDGLRNYMLGPAQRSPRTFNTYIKRLRSFLFWAEGQDLPVPPRFRKVLKLAPSYVGIDALTQAELLRVASLDFTAPDVEAYLAEAFPEPPPRVGRGGRGELSSADHIRLRHADAQQLGWQHVHPEQELIKKQLNKTTVVGLIPYLDDDVFRPVALLEKYRPLGLATCMPFVRDPWLYLPHLTTLARITRLKLGMHIGRKTYATLKIYQGVPARLVMLATGHQTEEQFNVYLGIDEQELLQSHRQTARRLPKQAA
jgi:integrase